MRLHTVDADLLRDTGTSATQLTCQQAMRTLATPMATTLVTLSTKRSTHISIILNSPTRLKRTKKVAQLEENLLVAKDPLAAKALLVAKDLLERKDLLVAKDPLVAKALLERRDLPVVRAHQERRVVPLAVRAHQNPKVNHQAVRAHQNPKADHQDLREDHLLLKALPADNRKTSVNRTDNSSRETNARSKKMREIRDRHRGNLREMIDASKDGTSKMLDVKRDMMTRMLGSSRGRTKEIREVRETRETREINANRKRHHLRFSTRALSSSSQLLRVNLLSISNLNSNKSSSILPTNLNNNSNSKSSTSLHLNHPSSQSNRPYTSLRLANTPLQPLTRLLSQVAP